MKKMKLAVITLLTAALCLSGCGEMKNNSKPSSGSYAEESSADTYEGEAAEEYASDAVEGDSGAGAGEGGSEESALRAQDGQKIVYTGSISMQSLEYDKSAASIRQKIKAAGGFSESESEHDNNYNWYNGSGDSGNMRYLSITARIPSDQFETFMNSLSGDGKVMRRSVNAENISQVYANKESYKKALEVERERLLEMMEKAESIDDMIAVEARLSEVERELNMYKTDLAAMDKDVEYSTVYIELEEVKRYTEEVVETPFGEEIRYAFEDAVTSFKDFCKGVVLFVVRYFPYLILWAVVIILINIAASRSRAKRLAMMSNPEYANMMNSKARARAEAEARKAAEKEAKRRRRKGLFGREKADPATAEGKPDGFGDSKAHSDGAGTTASGASEDETPASGASEAGTSAEESRKTD